MNLKNIFTFGRNSSNNGNNQNAIFKTFSLKPANSFKQNITPEEVRMAINTINTTDDTYYLNLAYMIIDTHYEAGTGSDNRCEAVAKLKKKITGLDEKIKEFLTKEVGKIKINTLKEIAEQTLIGKVAVQINYIAENGQIILDHSKPLIVEDLRNFTQNNKGDFLIKTEDKTFKPNEYKFIFTNTKPVLLRALTPVMYNETAWAYFARYLEKVSIPPTKGTYRLGASETAINKLYEAVQSITSDSSAVYEEGSNIEFMDGSKTGADKLFLNMIEKTEKAISKVLSGQNLTTEVGSNGSYAAAKVHKGILDTRVLFTAETIEQLITEQLIHRLIELNFANANPRDYAFILYEELQINKKEEFEIDKELLDRGLIGDDYIQNKYIDNKYLDTGKKKS